jgi:hypothetical protein
MAGGKRVTGEEFQRCKLAVEADQTASLSRDDGDSHIAFSKRIEFIDFSCRKSCAISPMARSCCRASIDRGRGCSEGGLFAARDLTEWGLCDSDPLARPLDTKLP